MTDFENLETKLQTPPPNRYSQLSQGLLWLNERAWPLSIGILLTAGMYLFQYIQEEKIPLSITSSAVITALPAMSAMLVFIISMLVAFIIMPIFVLFHPLGDAGGRLSDDFSFDQTSPELTARHRGLIWRWAGGLLILGIYCVLVGIVGPNVPPSDWWIGGGVLALVLTVLANTLFITRGVKVSVSTDFRFICVMSALVQVFVILTVTSVVLPVASAYVDNIWWLLPLMLLELISLWMIQLVGAFLVVKTRRHQNPVAFVATVVFAMVILLGLYPPSSSKLAGFALQVTASGGRNCTVMNFSADSKSIEAITDPAKPGYSRPLRVVAEVDGVYFVRLWRTESKAVQFVPRASVTGVDACPADIKTAKNATAESKAG
ncbi:hypothetical protein QF019_000280 [Pseudomonas frederiksbergensis]|uniref:hypothetical protein n=1 Tax=Pseudomonas frederiksbergensis TaxID=104087 RepID=UPI003D25E796